MSHIEKRGTARKPKYLARWKGADGAVMSQTFDTKGEAQRHLDKIASGKAGGTNKTLGELCDDFMGHARALQDQGTRERSTVEQYRQHVDHIKRDDVASMKLHRLGTPEVQRFLDRLVAGGMSVTTAKKVRVTLGRINRWGMRRGDIQVDVVDASEIEAATRVDYGEDGPVVIPPKEALARLLAAADARDDKGQAAAFVRVLLFCGLRMSELRGLARPAVVATGPKQVLKVTQRADKWNAIGAPKSAGSRRVVPLGPETAQAVRKWLLAAPKGDLGLVFPNGSGNVESHANFWNRLWAPLMGEAGLADRVTVTRKDRNTGKPKPVETWSPHYGFHAMRHAFASIHIENGVTPKKLSSLMGHATIKLTMDTYGHLWPDAEGDAGIASAAEGLIMGAKK